MHSRTSASQQSVDATHRGGSRDAASNSVDAAARPAAWEPTVVQRETEPADREAPNRTGLPDSLKSGIEAISGLALDDVRVRFNSQEPARFDALAYTQGSEIHLGPGQERHLPHEAWHVVQQKQGRVEPTGTILGAPLNDDHGLEHEADIMSARALETGSSSIQRKRWNPAKSVLQRQATSFPPDSEEQLKKEGALQRKSALCPMQFRGGAAVGTLTVKSSHVGSSLIAGHAWLSVMPTGGSEQTHGTWGNVDPIGYHANLEVGRGSAAERTTNIDAADQGTLNTFIAGNNAWSMINNCSSFAARGWTSVTGESLAYRSLGIPNPSALGVGITTANGGRSGGTLPADRGSSTNSISSTVSSRSGIASNTLNSALSSGGVGGSINASSGRGSL